MKAIFPLLLISISLASQPRSSVDLEKVRTIVQSWSDAHNSKDITAFKKLYGSSVLFYTQNLKREACLDSKAKVLSISDFHQDIITDLVISAYDGGIIKCEFTKRVLFNSVQKIYPSYLLLRQVNDQYFIVGESDLITDRNLKYNLSLGPKLTIPEMSVIPLKKDKQAQTKTNLWLIALVVFAIVIVGVVVTKKRIPQKDNLKIAPIIEVATPANLKEKYEQMGREFVIFVLRKFDRNHFTWKRLQTDQGIDGRFPLANQDPDLEFVYSNSHPFAVECKFKTKLYNGRFVLENRQLDNYRRFSQSARMGVHIILGLGGQPGSPDELYIIPLRRFHNTSELSFDQLQEFKKRLTQRDFFYTFEKDILT